MQEDWFNLRSILQRCATQLRRGWPNNAKRILELDARLAQTFRHWHCAKKTRMRKTCQICATRRMMKTETGGLQALRPRLRSPAVSVASTKNPRNSLRSMMPKAEISQSQWYEKHGGWK